MNANVNNLIASFVRKSAEVKQYNPFDLLNLNENGHTKMLLSLLAYRDINGNYPVLQSFFASFAKGRGKMIHYKRPSKVEIRFGVNFIDGLITFEASGKRHAVIIENKIFNAPDQKDQVRRYISYVNNHMQVNLDNIWVFYLTGDENKMVDIQSYDTENEGVDTNIGNRFIQITYNNDIAQWIVNEVLNVGVYPEQLTAMARVYADYLQKHLFCLGAKIEEQNRLLTCLGMNKDMKKWERDDIEGLYNLQNEISILRGQNIESDDKKDGNNIDREALNRLYNTLTLILKRLEDVAFDRFERMTVEFLNAFWGPELRKVGAKWRVARRGVNRQNGFVQVRCVEDWGTAHIEWCDISTADMMCGTEYKIQLHVERNKPLAQEWKNVLESKPFLLPLNATISNTSRVLKIDITTDTPIAKMKDAALHDFIESFYTGEMSQACRLLVERIKDYK